MMAILRSHQGFARGARQDAFVDPVFDLLDVGISHTWFTDVNGRWGGTMVNWRERPLCISFEVTRASGRSDRTPDDGVTRQVPHYA